MFSKLCKQNKVRTAVNSAAVFAETRTANSVSVDVSLGMAVQWRIV